MPKHGKHKKRRKGVHKNARSPETKHWEAEHLIPEKPDWMGKDVYTDLATLRSKL